MWKTLRLAEKRKERKCCFHAEVSGCVGRIRHHSPGQISVHHLVLCTWGPRTKEIFVKAKKIGGISQPKMPFDLFQFDGFLRSGFHERAFPSDIHRVHPAQAMPLGNQCVLHPLLCRPSFPLPSSSSHEPHPRDGKSIWKPVTTGFYNSRNGISLLISSR